MTAAAGPDTPPPPPSPPAASGEWLQLALDAAGTALWDVDLASGHVRMDERWEVMLGGPRRESSPSTQDLLRLTHPADRARLLALQRDALVGRTDEYAIDHRVRTRSGSWVWIHSHGRVVARDARGRARRVIGANTDITARKYAEQEVAEQKEFLAALQDITLEMLQPRPMAELLRSLLARATGLLDGTHGQVLLVGEGQLVVRAMAPHAPTENLPPIARADSPGSWEVVDQRRPRVIDDFPAGGAGDARYASFALRALAEFPILRDGECVGVLAIGRSQAGRPFRPVEIERGLLLARMTALVLHHADIRHATLSEAAARTVALRESEEKFRGVFDGTAVPMVLAGMPDGRLVEFNAAAIALFGWSPREARGRLTLDLGVWADPADRVRLLDELRVRGRVDDWEIVMTRRDGLAVGVLCSAVVIHIGGQPHALASLVDITARRGAERALRESEEKFRALFHKGPIPIVVSRLRDGVIVDANSAAAAFSGFTLARDRGKTSLELAAWVDPAQREQYAAQLGREGAVAGFEATLRLANGQIAHVLFYSTVLHVGGEPVVMNSLLDITERKAIEAARDRSLSLMQATLEATADGILVVSLAREVEAFNRTFVTMWRIPDELQGGRDSRPLNRHAQAQLRDPERFARQVEEAFRNPEQESFHLLELRDGRVLEQYSRPQLVNGVVAGRVWSFRDVTERRQADEALRRAEAKYREIFEHSLEGLYQTTPDGRFLAANPALAHMLGYSTPEELMAARTDIGQQGYVHPEQRAEFKRLMAERGAVNEFEYEVWRRDRTRIWVAENARAVRDENGVLLYYEGSMTDITVRKDAVAAIAESEERFRGVFDKSPIPITLAQMPEGQLVDANPAAVALLYGADRPYLGRTSVELGVWVEPAERERYAARLNEHGTIVGFEARLRTPAGEVRDMLLTGSLVHIGGQVYALTSHVDITERVCAEAQQRALEQQLRQAQKMDALGTLAGGIAHDFNNLLTAILGHSEIALLDLEPGHPAIASLRAVRDAAIRSRDLVKQILTFSRRTDSARTPLRLPAVVEDSFRLLRSTIPAMVRMEQRLDPACPPIQGDATQIHQVLMNLCTNAWHALPERDGWIEIRVDRWICREAAAAIGRDLKPGEYVRLAVADNGHGMDNRTLDRIFDPFFTTKPVGKGTGLGLSMVHGIVKAHDASIRVETAPGRGTTIQILFPAIAATVVPLASGSRQLARGRGERILYVDDDVLAARAIAQLLERLGYAVEHHADPAAALAAFRMAEPPPALVITDLAMPGMSGTALAAETLRHRPQTPVLLITGHLDPVDDDAVRQAGVREILRKPMSPAALADAVRRVLASGSIG